MRHTFPHNPHVTLIIPPFSLTEQLSPGTRGARHPLQKRLSLGMPTWVFMLILLAIPTYLRARSVLPALRASTERSSSLEMRSAPMRATSLFEIRLLDIVLCRATARVL